MIGVWTCWTNGPPTAGPQGLTQGTRSSTLGVVDEWARASAKIVHMLHVDDHCFGRLMQSSGKVVIGRRLRWTSAGKAH